METNFLNDFQEETSKLTERNSCTWDYEKNSIIYVLCEGKKNHNQIDVNDIYPCKITIYMIIKNHIKVYWKIYTNEWLDKLEKNDNKDIKSRRKRKLFELEIYTPKDVK